MESESAQIIVLRDELAAVNRKHENVANEESALVMNDLAACIAKEGPVRFIDANRMFRDALTMASSACGTSHATVRLIQQNLGVFLCQRGPTYYKEAEEYLRGALRSYEEATTSIGGVHAMVATALGSLAHLLKLQGRVHFEEALRMFRRALMIEEKLHAADGGMHHDVASSLNSTAMLLIEMDSSRWPEAMEMAQRALKIEESLHADVKGVHAATATYLGNFAALLRKVDRKSNLEQMITLDRRALEIFEQLHSRVNGVHPEVAFALGSLAISLREHTTPDYVEIEGLHTRALNITKVVWEHADTLHPDVARSYLNLGAYLAECGDKTRLAEAEKMLRHSLIIYMDWMLCSAGALDEMLPKAMYWLCATLQDQNVDKKLVSTLNHLRTDVVEAAMRQESDGRACAESAHTRRHKYDRIRKAFDLIVDARDELGAAGASAARSARVLAVMREIFAWFGCQQTKCHRFCVPCRVCCLFPIYRANCMKLYNYCVFCAANCT